MKLSEYQKLAIRTIDHNKIQSERLKEFTLALCEESGETAGVLKKILYHNHPFTDEKQEKLIGELGDVLWHIATIAHDCQISLDEIATYNINKLAKRYPQGFSSLDSIKRVDTLED